MCLVSLFGRDDLEDEEEQARVIAAALMLVDAVEALKALAKGGSGG